MLRSQVRKNRERLRGDFSTPFSYLYSSLPAYPAVYQSLTASCHRSSFSITRASLLLFATGYERNTFPRSSLPSIVEFVSISITYTSILHIKLPTNDKKITFFTEYHHIFTTLYQMQNSLFTIVYFSVIIQNYVSFFIILQDLHPLMNKKINIQAQITRNLHEIK